MTRQGEIKVGDTVLVVGDYPNGHPMGPHLLSGQWVTVTEIVRSATRDATDCTVRALDGGRTFYADLSHLSLDLGELPAKADFTPGSWVHLDGVDSNFFYVMPDTFDEKFLLLRPMHVAIEGETGIKTFIKRVSPAVINPKSVDAIPLGTDVIVATKKRNAAYNRRGTVIQQIPCALGHDLYRVFLPESGYEYLYASELRLDADALTPDEHGHVHRWTVKWDGTFRECLCGVKQWQLACWSRHTWQEKLPANQKSHHPDLDFDKSSTKRLRDIMGEVDGWTSEPHRTRSYGIIPKEILDTPINIVGCGAIGSFTALSLMKMGFKRFHLWDPDVVAIENIGTQLYGHVHLGVNKVDALKNILNDHGPENEEDQNFAVTAYAERWQLKKVGCPVFEDPDDCPDEDCEHDSYPEHATAGGIVILAVDSMKARKEIWDSIQAHHDEVNDDDDIPYIDWVIDGRMGAEHALMYTIDPGDSADIVTYQKTLYSDEDALQEPCTAAGTAYTAGLIAGWICKSVKDVLTRNPKYIRIGTWNIADNQQVVYHKENAFPPEHPQSLGTITVSGGVQWNAVPQGYDFGRVVYRQMAHRQIVRLQQAGALTQQEEVQRTTQQVQAQPEANERNRARQPIVDEQAAPFVRAAMQAMHQVGGAVLQPHPIDPEPIF